MPPSNNLIAIRENANGLFCCAEEFVQRIDSPGKGSLIVHTAQYGKALAGAKVAFSLVQPLSGVGGGQPGRPNPPKATIPVIGAPPKALSFPESLTSDQDGRARKQ
jgi:hypothetical protein